MADINLNINSEDLEKIQKYVQELQKALETLQKTVEKMGTITKDDIDLAKQYNQAQMSNTAEVKRRKAMIDAEKGSIAEVETKVKELTKSWKATADQAQRSTAKKELDQAKRDLQQLKGSTNEWGKALSSFQFKFNALGNIASSVLSGITGDVRKIVKEFTGFEKIINSTDKSADDFQKTIQALKNSFLVLNQAIASGSLDNLFENIQKAAKAGRDYADALDDIADRQRQLSIAEADTLQRQAELTEIWKNPEGTKSVKEQADALRELIKINQTLANQRAKIATDLYEAEIRNTSESIGLTKEQIETFLKYYDVQQILVDVGSKLNKIQSDYVSSVSTSILTGTYNVTEAKEGETAALEAQAAQYGLTGKQAQEYANLVSRLNEDQRNSIVNLYKTMRQEQSGAILENKRLLGALGTLMEEYNRSIAKSTKETTTVISEELIKLGNELLLPLDQYRAKQSEITQFAYTNSRTRIQATEEEKAVIVGIYADLFAQMAAITDQHTVAFKALAIFEATLNAYLAALDAMRRMPTGPVGKLAAYGIILAAGLSVIARIKSVTAPKYAEGGEIGGKAHSQGGTMIEAERGEFVVKKSAYARNRELVNAINAEDSARIALAMRVDKKHPEQREDYTRKLYEFMKNQPVYGETKDYFIIHKGNQEIKLHKN